MFENTESLTYTSHDRSPDEVWTKQAMIMSIRNHSPGADYDQTSWKIIQGSADGQMYVFHLV